jgi:hypothetical protein
MNFVLQPWHIMLLAASAWVNREQAHGGEYSVRTIGTVFLIPLFLV